MKTQILVFLSCILMLPIGCSNFNRFVSPSEDEVSVPSGDCMPQPFSVTYATYKSDRDSSYFIKGEVIEIVFCTPFFGQKVGLC
jgi:hypothetical protein